MPFFQKVSLLLASLFIGFIFFNSANANTISKKEKAYIYMTNLSQQSTLLSNSLSNYIKIKENIYNKIETPSKKSNIQKDINNAFSMLTAIHDYSSKISMVSDYINNWENGKTLYGKDLIINDNEIKPITAIIIDVFNKKFQFQRSNEIIESDKLITFYKNNKPQIIYTDKDIQSLIGTNKTNEKYEQQRIKEEQREQENKKHEILEKKALEEAITTLRGLRTEMGIDNNIDISNLTKQEIDREIYFLREKKKQRDEQRAEEEKQQKIAQRKQAEEALRLENERRRAEGLESIEEQQTRIKEEKEALESIKLGSRLIAMSAGLVKVTPEKFSKSERNEILGASQILLDEVSQAENICGADVILQASDREHSPCINSIKKINLMMKIWAEE